ncbi:40373_t:CDS:1, partial [Gigaspora margarita]
KLINIEENKNNDQIKKLLIEYHEKLLKIKEDEIKRLKEKINDKELILLNLILKKQKDLGIIIKKYQNIIK